MPYQVVKVDGGYKVKKKGYERYYSHNPMPKERAYAQMRALYASFREASPGRKYVKSPTRKYVKSPTRKRVARAFSPTRSPIPKRNRSPVPKRQKSPIVKRKNRSKMIARILGVRTNWSKSLRKSDIEGILNCYSKNPIFKGTMSKNVTKTRAPLKNYFVNFMKKEPKVKFNDYDIVKTGDVYIESGNYTFMTSDEIINANYQFIYEEINDELKIISHYSCMN